MDEDSALFFKTYQKIEKASRKFFQREFSEYDFTPNEILVILFLYNHGPELNTATDIARIKNVSKGMIARSVEALCSRNYLESVRDTHDRRIIHLHLKDEHNHLAARIKQAQEKFFKNLLTGISEEDIRQAKNTLNQLMANAEFFLNRRDINERSYTKKRN